MPLADPACARTHVVAHTSNVSRRMVQIMCLRYSANVARSAYRCAFPTGKRHHFGRAKRPLTRAAAAAAMARKPASHAPSLSPTTAVSKAPPRAPDAMVIPVTSVIGYRCSHIEALRVSCELLLQLFLSPMSGAPVGSPPAAVSRTLTAGDWEGISWGLGMLGLLVLVVAICLVRQVLPSSDSAAQETSTEQPNVEEGGHHSRLAHGTQASTPTEHLVADAIFRKLAGPTANAVELSVVVDYLVDRGDMKLEVVQDIVSKLDANSDGSIDRDEWRIGFSAGLLPR